MKKISNSAENRQQQIATFRIHVVIGPVQFLTHRPVGRTLQGGPPPTMVIFMESKGVLCTALEHGVFLGFFHPTYDIIGRVISLLSYLVGRAHLVGWSTADFFRENPRRKRGTKRSVAWDDPWVSLEMLSLVLGPRTKIMSYSWWSLSNSPGKGMTAQV